MARRRRIADFADMYLKYYMQRKLAEEQSKLTGQRQLEMAQQRAEQALYEKILSNPEIAMRLSRTRSQVAGQPLAPLLATPEDARRAALGSISGAKTIQDIPEVDPYFHSQLGAPAHAEGEDIQDLIAARNARIASLQSAVQPQGITRINPQGLNKEEVFLNPWEAAKQGPFQTELTPQQAGLREGQTAQAAQPGKTAAEVSNIRATTGPLAGRAGAISAAQTSAEINTRNKLLPILTKIEEEVAKARMTGKPTNAVAEKTIQQLGSRMIDLATSLNTEGSRFKARVGGVRQYAGNVSGFAADLSPATLGGRPVTTTDGRAMTRADAFHELEALRQGFTSVLLRKLGRVGTPTENDEKRTRQILPSWGLTPTENNTTNANFKKILGAAEMIGQSMGPIDPSLPTQQQEEETARRLQDLQNRALQPTFVVDPQTGQLIRPQ